MRGVGGRGVPSTRIVRARSRRCQRRAERAAAPRRPVGYCRSDRWDLVPWPPAHAARCRRSSCSSQRAARRLPPSSQRLVRRSSRLGRTAGWGSQPPPRGCSAAAPTSIRAWRTTGPQTIHGLNTLKAKPKDKYFLSRGLFFAGRYQVRMFKHATFHMFHSVSRGFTFAAFHREVSPRNGCT